MSEPTPQERLGDAPTPVLPTHPEVATWRGATAADIDAIHRVAAAADAVDHPTWITPREDIADEFELSHIDPERDMVVALNAEGLAIGFASAVLHPARQGTLTVHISGAVDPAWRRRGIGGAGLGWALARGREQVATAIAAGAPADILEIKVYAEESTPDLVAIAEERGFHIERWFTTMVRDMDGVVPETAEVADIRIVPYTSDRDEDARAARNDAFRDHWGSLPTTAESWQKFVGGEFFRPELSRLALDAAGAIAGFCLVSVNEDDWEALGASHAYIDLIGVVRGQRRRGIAPRVISEALRAIADADLAKAVLDVDTASPTGANTLYENLGFHATERSLALVRRF